MRMSSPRRSSGFSARAWFVLLAVLLIIGIAIFPNFFGRVGALAGSPFYRLRVWAMSSESTIPYYFRSRNELSGEIERLKGELREHSYDEARLAALEDENALLKNLKGNDEKRPTLAASVVRMPNETPYDTVIIDKGSADGVMQDALVYGERYTAIGRVARAFDHSALVSLFTTAGVVTPVYVYGSNVFARGIGEGGGIIRVEVPQGINIAKGDPVVVPVSHGGIYGTVSYIESTPSDPAQYAYIAQEPALSELRFVAVDLSPLPKLTFGEAEKYVEEMSSTSAADPRFEGIFEKITDVGTSTQE